MIFGLLALALAMRPREGPEQALEPPRQPPHTVVLVVLDTVRADHTSLCGYARPTTPVLLGLLELGATHTCRAYAPSSWTLPSHASYFTGLDVPAHETGATLGDIAVNGARAQPLRRDVPTLAQRFAERGYDTTLVAANPLVGRRTQLARGFDRVRTARHWSELRGGRLGRALGRVLARTDAETPLFLTVNILDAHNDWRPIPKGVDWVPPRQGLALKSTRARYEAMEEGPERRAIAEQLTDLYDYALSQADRNLGAVLRLLEAHGRLDEHFRLVVTSDHGEYLGEHGRLAHGGTGLHEEVTRVPLLVHDSDKPIDLPEVVSALAVHDLLLEGRVTVPAGEAFAGKLSNDRRDADVPCATTGAALWLGFDKLHCAQGRLERFDLASDPSEAAPQPIGAHRGRAQLLEYARRLEATNRGRTEGDPELARQLEALGYVE